MKALIIFMALSLGGCGYYIYDSLYNASPINQTIRISENGEVYLNALNVSMTVPSGWLMRVSIPTGFVIDKNRSTMRIGGYDTRTYKTGTSLDGSMRKFESMAPLEVASSLMSEIKERNTDLKVIESAPYEFGGKQGFRVAYSYGTRSWPAKKGIYYGCMVGSWHYHIIYESDFGTFARDLPDVEKLKNSFKFNEQDSPS